MQVCASQAPLKFQWSFTTALFKGVLGGLIDSNELWIVGANLWQEWMQGATLVFLSANCVWVRFIVVLEDLNTSFDFTVESFGVPVAERSAIVFAVVLARGHKPWSGCQRGTGRLPRARGQYPIGPGRPPRARDPSPRQRRKRVRRGRSSPLGVGAGSR